MIRARAWRAALAAVLLAACSRGGGGAGGEEQATGGKVAPFTMVVGIDVSGSFRDAHLYDDAVDFAATYIYAHLRGLDGLHVPSALFVGSVGGARSVEQIAADLRAWFPPTDPYTDFNAFFQRVSSLVKERGLILAPLNVVVLSDGVPDLTPGMRLPSGTNPYTRIDLSPLEFLSRSVTVRLLYANPTVGDNWKKIIKRHRVRLWTQEAQVMAGWHQQFKPGVPLAEQHDLWKWVRDNVDFRVRAGNLF